MLLFSSAVVNEYFLLIDKKDTHGADGRGLTEVLANAAMAPASKGSLWDQWQLVQNFQGFCKTKGRRAGRAVWLTQGGRGWSEVGRLQNLEGPFSAVLSRFLQKNSLH